MNTHMRARADTHTHTYILTHTHARTHAHIYIHTVTHTHIHTHTHHSICHMHKYTHTHSLSLSLSLSHTHTHTWNRIKRKTYLIYSKMSVPPHVHFQMSYYWRSSVIFHAYDSALNGGVRAKRNEPTHKQESDCCETHHTVFGDNWDKN